MLELGEYYGVSDVVENSGVNGLRGLQCGIPVNYVRKLTVLIQTIQKKGGDRTHPNR